MKTQQSAELPSRNWGLVEGESLRVSSVRPPSHEAKRGQQQSMRDGDGTCGLQHEQGFLAPSGSFGVPYD